MGAVIKKISEAIGRRFGAAKESFSGAWSSFTSAVSSLNNKKYDLLPDLPITGADAAETKTSKKKKRIKQKQLSPKLKDLIFRVQINFAIDDEAKESYRHNPAIAEEIVKDLNKASERYRKAFEEVALQDPKLIEQCLKNIDSITAWHIKWSRHTMLQDKNIAGGYHDQHENVLKLGFVSKYLTPSTIRHECSHVEEGLNDIRYNLKKIKKCYDNIGQLFRKILEEVDQLGGPNVSDQTQKACPTLQGQILYKCYRRPF